MADEPRGLPVPQARPGAAQNVGVAVAQIPGRLVGGTAIKVTPDGLNYSVSLDISKLGKAPAADLAATWVPAWIDDSAGQTYRVTLATLSVSLPIPWDNITGKPATFPPTLPIPSSGVTGLDGALAAIATHTSEISALDGRADALESKLADGDKGDIVVSAGGTVWTIDATYTAQWMPKTGGVFTGPVNIVAPYPALLLTDEDAPATHKMFSVASSGGYFHLVRNTDVGGYVDSVLTVDHATGIVSFQSRPYWAGVTPWDSGNLNNFTGDAGSGGTKGLVPAPGAGDAAAGKVLGADGTWVTQPGAVPAGQCELIKSGSNIVLVPRNGNVININGVNRNISASGASLAPTGLTVSSLYYVYAYWTGSAVALEASTTGHSTNSATGVETKTDDATRTLVGAVRPIAGPAFADTETQRFVASWFNPPELTLRAQVTATQTTTSTSFTELTTSLRIEMVVLKRVVPHVSITGLVRNSGEAVSLFAAGYDGISVVSEASGYAGASLVPMTHNDARQLSEGYHSVTVVGAVSAASTAILAGAPDYPVIIRATL